MKLSQFRYMEKGNELVGGEDGAGNKDFSYINVKVTGKVGK